MSDVSVEGPGISIGFLDNFKGLPTLLFLGESQGFFWLAKLIESGWTGEFSTLQDKVHLAGIQLELKHSVATRLERDGTRLRWYLSDGCREAFPEQLQELARSDRPGHTYLDSASGPGAIQVIASKANTPHRRFSKSQSCSVVHRAGALNQFQPLPPQPESSSPVSTPFSASSAPLRKHPPFTLRALTETASLTSSPSCNPPAPRTPNPRSGLPRTRSIPS